MHVGLLNPGPRVLEAIFYGNASNFSARLLLPLALSSAP